MDSSTVGIIQARMGSTRLEEKALKKLGGYPLTEFLVRRVAAVLPRPILALPAGARDDKLAARAKSWPCEVVRGPEEDVLERFAIALAERPGAESFLRITGDNPLMSRELLRLAVQKYENSACDWGYFRDVPLGAATGIFNRDWLLRANREVENSFDREHVTTWIKNHSGAKKAVWRAPTGFRAPGFRLTVDTEADLKLVRRLVGNNGPEEVSTARVIEKLAESPELIKINSHVRQKDRKDSVRFLYCLNRGGKWGHGHFSRMKSIYQQLKNREHRRPLDFYLLAGSEEKIGHERLINNYNSSLKDREIIRWTRRVGANYVILDIKNSSQDLIRTLKAEKRCVVGIEDRGDGRKMMDRVVDPNLYSGQLEKDEVPMKSRGYGPRFALVDPRFSDNRPSGPPDSLRDVGVCFGGTDPEGLREKFLDIVRKHPEVTFHLFASSGAGLKVPGNLRVKGQVSEPWTEFSRMDFMVISGGNLKFEVAALGLGALVIAQHQEQYDNSRRFVAINKLRWPVLKGDSSTRHWEDELLAADNPDLLKFWWERGPEVVDGKGIGRLLADFAEIKT